MPPTSFYEKLAYGTHNLMLADSIPTSDLYQLIYGMMLFLSFGFFVAGIMANVMLDTNRWCYNNMGEIVGMSSCGIGSTLFAVFGLNSLLATELNVFWDIGSLIGGFLGIALIVITYITTKLYFCSKTIRQTRN
ncbi:hypothetical protein A2533_01210 [Candidatus Falkowbacteria bacterium RIFOXYD2_FULL_35_9]|uniref:Uncharacterized protein n=1 Tax=Candidatus Falkowbacteria bacterium RIFOXYC2_FULL_36_12 TaxID=1798002 RepID=A0A1F5T325_9BACT|nr:MAG: hypothetical protein A2300_02220 [Candidatus Falkowbacteria bacterium RIFOXYB2_FULL_35_7]OGF33319.1 MAG: hypothetical protein A2478_01295 [Candidatus Falkowbacteria bacterium RIFOXYC2_FULL_36_12]OGF34869.1 MAG: hypothetical protein A2223_00430 [Candidatus Falkowbacteria bacterium RIFOXYA2_FULL_35_8]OGF46737.1 MAG: hypothetical protein A2533_01210 [Candidatus Falkowbacteria bacterium RIFOXYD2_FULL_35_9]